jgi:DivIVA domain-containing protein
MPEGLPSISSSRVSTGDVARHVFSIGRRGYDPDEVKSYLQTVARSIEALEQREQELRTALADAEERAAHPVVDEATLTSSLGQHSAQILRHAHEEAARIVAQAQEGAATVLRESQSQANEIQARSESASAQRVAEAELMVGTAEQEARAEVAHIHEDAVARGEEVIARAKDEGRALLEQVHEARRRVLSDLATRRRSLSIQVEQLRAARDEMAATVAGVRDSVDVILGHLEHSDDEARAAALAAGDQARLNMPTEMHEVDLVAGAGVVEAGQGGEDGELGGPPPSVDELFARIRAGSDEEAEGGAATESAATVGTAEETTVVEAVKPEEPAEPELPESPEQALIDRRDELLTPITAQLARHIKRALGDDQNRLLDVLRGKPSVSGEALLGPEDLHLSTFTSAAQGHMDDAFVAGTVFGGAEAGGIPTAPAVEQAAAGLARTVVTMLRRRIAEGSEAGEDVSDRVGAAYRDWRGERIERLVGDFAVQAFSAGVTAAATPQGLVRWVLTSSSGCSDCDDNALAGAVTASDGFPTGHAYPPAHSGCRCLVASAPA